LLVQTQEFEGHIWSETWSPDETKLVFMSAGSYYKSGLWVINTDGSEPPEYLSDGIAALWTSPQEIMIVKKRRDSDNVTLISFDMVSRSKTMICQLQAENMNSVTWSPGRNKIAFAKTTSSENNYAKDLFILDAAQGTLVQLTKDGDSYNPSWSPVADVIAYTKKVKNKDGIPTNKLYLINSNGSCDIEVPGVIDSWSPTWSPDGERIAFTHSDEVFIVDLAEVFGDDFLSHGLICEN
jgi:Tol biopolymer transport system component